MKLTEKAKKRLTLAGLGVVCVVLVIAIASQFKAAAPKEADVQPSTTATNTLTPSVSTPAAAGTPTSTPEVNVKPITPTESASQVTDTGKPTGTDQSIQAEVTKPAEPSGEAKTNPSQKPDGQKVTNSDSSTSSSTTPKAGDKNSKGQVWVPGFGWVDDSGDNVGTSADDMYENGNKIGNMN
jgi:hypothetical protein